MQQAWCSCVKVHYLGKGRSTIFFAAEEAGAYCHRGAMAPPGHQAKEAPSNKLCPLCRDRVVDRVVDRVRVRVRVREW